MLAVIFYGLEVVYGFRERRTCRSDFCGTVSLETEWSCSLFVFHHWGMFAALAYRGVRLGLKYTRGARWTEFVTKVALNQRCDRNLKF